MNDTPASTCSNEDIIHQYLWKRVHTIEENGYGDYVVAVCIKCGDTFKQTISFNRTKQEK